MQDEVEVVARKLAIVPREATEAMLRPFFECPPDELPLAWEAAMFIGSKLAAALRQRPVIDDDAYCDNVLDPLWRDYGEDSVQYQTALAAYRQMRHRPVVDDARMARALDWLRNVVALGFPVTSPEHLPAIEEAIAAYDPNCGGRTVRVVDDAMVEAVWSALDPGDVPGLTRRKLRAALKSVWVRVPLPAPIESTT